MQPSGSAANGKERAKSVCRNWFFDLPWDLRRLIKRFVRVSMLCERFWHNLIALRELNRLLAISEEMVGRLQHDGNLHRFTTEHCILVNRGPAFVFEREARAPDRLRLPYGHAIVTSYYHHGRGIPHSVRQNRLHQAMFSKPPPGRREKNRNR